MNERINEKNIFVENDLSVVSTTLLWRIKNFTAIPQKHWIKSSQFLVCGYALYLNLKRSATCLYIHLSQDDMPNIISGLQALICLIDRQGKPRFFSKRNALVQEGDNKLHLLNITENSLKKPFNILSNDTLTIRCNVSVEDDQNNTEASQNAGNPLNKQTEEIACLETLSADFGLYYDAHMDCDTVLNVGGVPFPVHQAMLSARSVVLAEMLQEGAGCKVKQLEIPDIQSKILDNLLFYIYSGKVRGLNSDTATKMFTAADKLALLELKDICLKFIHSNLTVENVGEVALLAQAHDDEMLKTEVENFITNNVADVLKSHQWNEFTQQQYVLANSILSNVLLSSAKSC